MLALVITLKLVICDSSNAIVTYFFDECIFQVSALVFRARDSRCKHVVVFMHIPPFCNNVEEEDTIHSLPRTKRIELLEQFAESNVAAVFSGHYHRNAGGLWSKRHENGSTSEVLEYFY